MPFIAQLTARQALAVWVDKAPRKEAMVLWTTPTNTPPTPSSRSHRPKSGGARLWRKSTLSSIRWDFGVWVFNCCCFLKVFGVYHVHYPKVSDLLDGCMDIFWCIKVGDMGSVLSNSVSYIKKLLYVHCPWRKGCENFDGKNIRIEKGQKQGVHFFFSFKCSF